MVAGATKAWRQFCRTHLATSSPGCVWVFKSLSTYWSGSDHDHLCGVEFKFSALHALSPIGVPYSIQRSDGRIINIFSSKQLNHLTANDRFIRSGNLSVLEIWPILRDPVISHFPGSEAVKKEKWGSILHYYVGHRRKKTGESKNNSEGCRI